MKLLKTITPIITLTGLATVVAPLTSCTKSNGEEEIKYIDLLNGDPYTPKLLPVETSDFPTSMPINSANYMYAKDIDLVHFIQNKDLIADEIMFTYSKIFHDSASIEKIKEFAEFENYEFYFDYDNINCVLTLNAKISGKANGAYVTQSGIAVTAVDNLSISVKITNAVNFYFAHLSSKPFKGESNLCFKDNWVMGFYIGDGVEGYNQGIDINVKGSIQKNGETSPIEGEWQSKDEGKKFDGQPVFEEGKEAYYIAYYYLMSITQPILFTDITDDPWYNRLYFATNYYMNANIQ